METRNEDGMGQHHKMNTQVPSRQEPEDDIIFDSKVTSQYNSNMKLIYNEANEIAKFNKNSKML